MENEIVCPRCRELVADTDLHKYPSEGTEYCEICELKFNYRREIYYNTWTDEESEK